MPGYDEARNKLVAYFNRRGDVPGQALFTAFLVEVEKELNRKRELTIIRPVVGNGNSILDVKPKNAHLAEVVEHHHVSESNARWAAKRALVMFRQMEYDQRKELLRDDVFLASLCVGYKVKSDHWELFFTMVKEGAKEL